MNDVGLVTVGGRLTESTLDHDAMHPTILPANQRITSLIIWHSHVKEGHFKSERLVHHLLKKYWITSIRRVVKLQVNKCIPCKRRDAKPMSTIMAPLPCHHLTPYKPAFLYTGIDYFGPVTVKMSGRGSRQEKRWICLFTCLVTRAIHLEVAYSLNVDDFLICFSKFTSLRQRPRVIYSDNGTNLRAGEQELREAVDEWFKKQEDIQIYAALNDIEWHFSPPHGPHFGGVWERLVQSSKRAMRIVLGNQLVTDKILSAVVAEVSMLLNTRPLTHLSVDRNDPEPLTPNYFLYAQVIPYFPLKKVEENDLNISRSQFEQSQMIVDHFWKRWLTEYVPHLTERKKWARTSRNPEVGDLVLVVDVNTPRGQWPIGKIVEVIPSKSDQMIRQVKVNIATAKHILIRPITKLCLLATDEDLKISSSDLNGESDSSKVIGSVSKDATKPVITVDDVVEEKIDVKVVPVKSLQEEKPLDSK